MPALSKLIEALREAGAKHGSSVAQTSMAWAVAKGTLPLIGVTKPHHVTDATAVAQVALSPEEVKHLEQIADAMGVDVQASWEGEMDA